MEPITIIMIVVCAVLLAVLVYLVVKYFTKMTDEQRAGFIASCSAAVKTILAAAADGKITSAELMQIAQALIAVIASFAGKTALQVSEELGATEYIQTAGDEQIVVTENLPKMTADVFAVMTSSESDTMKEKLWNDMIEHEKTGETHYTITSDKWEYLIRNGQFIANPIYAK